MTEFKIGDIISYDNHRRFAVIAFISKSVSTQDLYWGIFRSSKEEAVNDFKDIILPNINKVTCATTSDYHLSHMSNGLTKEGEISIRIENWRQRIK